MKVRNELLLAVLVLVVLCILYVWPGVSGSTLRHFAQWMEGLAGRVLTWK